MPSSMKRQGSFLIGGAAWDAHLGIDEIAKKDSKPINGKCSDVLLRALEAEGVQYIFGIPGEENLDILESLRESSIKLILCRHEQAAGFMAATIGRLTGKPGVCLSTLGPGATNFSTAVAYAHLGGMPMFILTGQKPIRRSKQGHFQIVDIVDHFRPLTKMTKQVVDPALISSLTRQAFRVSCEEKPGPVHLEIPEDIAALASSETEYLYPAFQLRRPVADDKAIVRAVDLLLSARRPLLCIGAGANRKITQKMLRALMRETGIYAVCTQMGKGVIDESVPEFLGTTALSSNDLIHVAVESADLILNIGHDVVEKPPFFMKHGGLPIVIHINFYGAHVDSVYFPQHEVIGDIGNAIWRIKEALSSHKEKLAATWDPRPFKLVKDWVCRHIYNSPYALEETPPDSPMTIQRVVRDLRKALPADGVICLDNGMYKIWFARQYQAAQPNTVLLDNALATMGAGLPSAMATRLVVDRESPVVAVCGDGGFMMNSQEIETAVRLGMHVVVVIVNDSAYGMIKWKQGTSGFENFGLDCGNPDFKKYAEAYGAKGYNVRGAADFPSVLQEALGTKEGVHVLNVPITYDSSDKALNEELPKLVFQLREEVQTLMRQQVQPKTFSPASRPAPTLPPSVTEPALPGKVDWPLYLGGAQASGEAKPLAVKNKYTGNCIATVHMATPDQLDAAIDLCVKATQPMAALGSYERKSVLDRCVSAFKTRFEDFARVLAMEGGKPIKDARGEVQRLIDTFSIAAEEVTRGLSGECTAMDISERNRNMMQITKRFPIGPVAMVSPFNFPLNLAAHKIAPALAAGCPFVLKPASNTPLGALMIGEVLSQCPELPKGAFSILPCTRDAADMLTTDDRFKLLSFTGSPEVGWKMKARAGKKKTVLELGGNAACIVDSIPKEGLGYLVDRIVFGAYYQSGQSCISTQRLLIRQDLYDKVVPALAAKVNSLKSGDPLDESTFIGPMISSSEAKRLHSWVEGAVNAGARVLAGSVAPPSGAEGNMLPPVMLGGVPPEADLWREEAFGPALCVGTYSDFARALEEVNSSKFGIHAGIFSEDMDKCFLAFETLEVGGVVVGDVPSIRVDSMPYGGVKDSGIGREGVKYAMEDMTEIRAMLMKNVGNVTGPRAPHLMNVSKPK